MAIFTIEAAIWDTTYYPYFQTRASEYQQILRRMHVEVNCRGKQASDVVKDLLRSEGWSSRQLNAIKIELEGMTLAWEKGLQRRIKELSARIARLEKIISDEKDKNAQHHCQRKLARLKSRLTKWEALLKAGKPNFCFGGRKLFDAQHHLPANGYSSQQAWLEDWQRTRSDSFAFIGKAADAHGCADCQMEIREVTDHEVSAVLKLRKLNREIPTSRAGPADFISIPVTFRYNIPYILAAVEAKQALSYRFFQREGRWRVHLITSIVPPPKISDARNGSMGVDLNPECIATALIKADGNPSQIVTYDMVNGHRTAHQTKDELGNVVASLVSRAVHAHIPIVIEKLNFQQIQKELKSRGLNRRLSKFKFSLFEVMLRTRAAKFGIEVISVNPAYTSVIGYFKFGYGNGLNRHESAAVAIARRIRRPGNRHFSERLRFRTKHPEAPNPTTLLPPATDGNRHPWKGWRKLGSLLAKTTQNGKTRSPACPAGGGIPTDDDLDYSLSVTSVPTVDNPGVLQT